MKKRLLHYWLAMNASAVQSAAHAGKAWLAVAGAHAAAESIPALSLNQFAAVLAFAFLLALLEWLDKNPLPVGEGPPLDSAPLATPLNPPEIPAQPKDTK